MKLVIVTTVQEFHSDALKLFKDAQIESVSGSEIDGYKNIPTFLTASNWFSGLKAGAESSLFFSFTDDDHIDILFRLIEAFNSTKRDTYNPIKAVVVPIERSI